MGRDHHRPEPAHMGERLADRNPSLDAGAGIADKRYSVLEAVAQALASCQIHRAGDLVWQCSHCRRQRRAQDPRRQEVPPQIQEGSASPLAAAGQIVQGPSLQLCTKELTADPGRRFQHVVNADACCIGRSGRCR